MQVFTQPRSQGLSSSRPRERERERETLGTRLDFTRRLRKHGGEGGGGGESNCWTIA